MSNDKIAISWFDFRMANTLTPHLFATISILFSKIQYMVGLWDNSIEMGKYVFKWNISRNSIWIDGKHSYKSSVNFYQSYIIFFFFVLSMVVCIYLWCKNMMCKPCCLASIGTQTFICPNFISFLCFYSISLPLFSHLFHFFV